jgi:hypothetical protein
MFLKKFAENNLITIDYDVDGAITKMKGRVCGLNLREQILSLTDENHKPFSIKLSGIRYIY